MNASVSFLEDSNGHSVLGKLFESVTQALAHMMWKEDPVKLDV